MIRYTHEVADNQIIIDIANLLNEYALTDAEVEVLNSLLLDSKFISLGNTNGAQWWLQPNRLDSAEFLLAQLRALRVPYEDLPLHINDKETVMAILVRWRLKIGR